MRIARMRVVRNFGIAAGVACLWAGAALAQEPVLVPFGSPAPGALDQQVQDREEIVLAQRSRGTGGGARVYLLRGFLGVFSTGMDDLNDKLNRSGIRASVHSHTEFSTLVGQVVRARGQGIRQNVVIIGHSLGANDSLSMAAELGRHKIPVSLIITFDPTASLPVPGNVSRVVNFYSAANGWGAPLVRSASFRGSLSNVDLSNDPSMGHTEIDKSPRLHNRSIAYIRGARAAEPEVVASAPRAAAATPKGKSEVGAAIEAARAAEAAKRAMEIPPTESAEKADVPPAMAAAADFTPAAAPESAPAERSDEPAASGASSSLAPSDERAAASGATETASSPFAKRGTEN
jgi:hypothetical protein